MEIKPLKGNVVERQIVALGRRMFEESRFARLGFSDPLATAYARRMLSDPMHISLGAFHRPEMAQAQLVGLAVGVCGVVLPFSAAVVAQEHLLYIAPEFRSGGLARQLIFAFADEARARGARDLMFSNGTGVEPERVGRLFESCGLSRVGGLYVKEW